MKKVTVTLKFDITTPIIEAAVENAMYNEGYNNNITRKEIWDMIVREMSHSGYRIFDYSPIIEILEYGDFENMEERSKAVKECYHNVRTKAEQLFPEFYND